MMDVTPRLVVGAKLIQSYSATAFVIAGERFEQHMLVSPQSVQPLAIANLEALDAQSIAAQLPPDTEVLLVGTGAKHTLVPPAFKQAMKARGIGVDTMDTGAACRTYNILLSEGRLVSAALMISGND